MVSRFYLIWLTNTYYPRSGIVLLTNPGSSHVRYCGVPGNREVVPRHVKAQMCKNHGSAYLTVQIALFWQKMLNTQNNSAC